jgi:hypothetical protein
MFKFEQILPSAGGMRATSIVRDPPPIIDPEKIPTFTPAGTRLATTTARRHTR